MQHPRYPSVIADYTAAKEEHPHAIVFFRMGDFYETFDQDAEIVARELDLVLLTRKNSAGEDVRMAGVPHHTAETYIARLIGKGFPAVMCEPKE